MKTNASRILPFALMAICLLFAVKGWAQHKSNQTATIIFGQGGGVTGKYTEYALEVDRNLYRIDTESGEKIHVQKLKRKICKRLFNEAENLGLMRMEFNHPFNINYYIIYRKGTDEKKLNWGDARNPPPDGVKELWGKLWELTK